MLEPRPAVRAMRPYSPPTEGRAGKLRLDFNENTVGASPHVVEALQRYLTSDALSVYPEYAETKPALARFFGVAENQFILTNGTDEAIQVLINTFVDDGQPALLLHPSYAMYRFYAEVAGAKVVELRYRGDMSFPIDELLAAIAPQTRAILIANPNNPTGTGITRPEIERILDAAPQAAVLIDEAYYEFSGVTTLDLITAHPNLFVSRTFSKVYGMAAMRVGCLFSQASNVAHMHKAQSPYSVNMLAAVAARAAIEDAGYVRAYVAEALAARDDLYAGFRRLSIASYPSHGNFILFRAGSQSIAIRDRLRDRGVLVRDRSYEVPGCVRVTAGTREQARRFLDEVEQLLPMFDQVPA